MKKIIIANLKMAHLKSSDAARLAVAVKNSASGFKNTLPVICAPFIWIESVSSRLRKSGIEIGAQDSFWETEGSYTGEISPAMLKNCGVKYVILGHSERRRFVNETDEMVNKKIKAVLKSGLKAVFCVGERERDESGEYLKFVKNQLLAGLAGVKRADLKNLIVVYEPVWAISTAKKREADTPKDLFEMSVYMRKLLILKFGRKAGDSIPIVYGGSVDASNARDFIEQGGVSGVLVGRASWKADTFVKLLKSLN
jgi:triosephosphate isomerase